MTCDGRPGGQRADMGGTVDDLRRPSPQERALTRAVRFAQASAVVLTTLAALSTLVNARQPGSAHFAISILALGSGIAEWWLAKRLACGDRRAPTRLALNQLVLGAGILIYGWLQARAMNATQVRALLERPVVESFLRLLPPEEIQLLHDILPALLRVLYGVVGIGGALGCGAVALYYRSRRRLLSPSEGEIDS